MARSGGVGSNFETVLAAAQLGASWASSTLWMEYAPAISAFLTARGSAEPEDLTSDVFIAVLDALPTFTGDEPAFRSFVFSIAYRRLVDELRKRSRRGPHDEWSDELDPRRAPSAEAVAESRLADNAALDALNQLPEAQRDVMVLRIIADLTVEQVASVLGKRPGAVKALQRRALESLRKNVAATRTLFVPLSDSEK